MAGLTFILPSGRVGLPGGRVKLEIPDDRVKFLGVS
jgi:hypothetical protein